MPTATAEPRTDLLGSLRDRLTAAAPDKADIVLETLTEAIQARKHVSVTCRKCNTTTRAEILDAVAATNAVKLLLEQTEGRPPTADADQGQVLTIERGIAAAIDPTELLALLNTGAHDQLRETLTEAANAQHDDDLAHRQARESAGSAAPA